LNDKSFGRDLGCDWVALLVLHGAGQGFGVGSLAVNVRVKLYASFRKGRFKDEFLDLSPGCTVRQVVQGLRIEEDALGVVLKNGCASALEVELKEDDEVSILPLIGGG